MQPSQQLLDDAQRELDDGLTIEKAAENVGVSARCIYKWLRKKLLKRQPGRVRELKTDCDSQPRGPGARLDDFADFLDDDAAQEWVRQ